MIKQLFTLLLSLCAILPLTAQTTVWEGPKEFDSSWPYVIIPAEELQKVAGGNTLTFHYENFDDSNGQLFINVIEDNTWNSLTYVGFYTDGLEMPNGSYTLKLDDTDAARVLAGGIAINGCDFTLNKITFEAGKPNRYLYDMIWFEDSNFETITELNLGNWDSKWECFPHPTCEASISKDGYNGSQCMKLKLNKATDYAFNAIARYKFDAPLTPGDYQISFRARADRKTSLLTCCGNESYYNDGYNQFDIDTEWKTYEFDFNTLRDDLSRLVFNFGNPEPTEIYIDDLRFGPYLAEKPDPNILFKGTYSLDGKSAPLYLPDDIKTGDVLRFTFSDQSPYYSNLYLASVADSETIRPQMFAPSYGTVFEIGITEKMLDSVKKGVKLCNTSGILTEIRVIRNVFNHKNILTYGRNEYNGDFIMALDNLDNYDKKFNQYIQLSIVAQYPSSSSPTIVAEGQSYGLSPALPSPSATNSDGSVIYTFWIDDYYKSLITDKIRIKNLDSPILYTFIGAPSNFYAGENSVCIWDQPFAYDWSKWMRLEGSLFEDMKEGDKLIITLENVKGDYSTIQLSNGEWYHLDQYYVSSQDPMLGADGRTMWERTMTAEEIDNIKSTGIILQGTDCTISGIYIEYAEKPAEKPTTLFLGAKTLSETNTLDIPLDNVKAGDVMRIHFAHTSDDSWKYINVVKNNVSRSDERLVIPGIPSMSNVSTYDGHVDIGVTKEMLDFCGGSLTIIGQNWTVNKVETIPSAFEPEGMICYGRRPPYGTTCNTTLPDNTDELILTLESPADGNGEFNLGFSDIPGSDTIFWLFNMDPVIDNGDGTLTVKVPLTNANINTINSEASHGIFVYHEIPLLSISYTAKQSGINDIAGDDADAPAVYYNMQGVRVDAPSAPGIYIRRQGNTATKIQVK